MLQLTGGEPTLHPDFKILVQMVNDLGGLVSINSNGIMPVKWWHDIIDKIHNINLTYHHESADSKKFIALVRFLGTKIRVNICITMHPDYFEKNIIVLDELIVLKETLDISITAKPLYIIFGTQLYNYTPEQLGFLKHSTQKTQGEYKNQVRGEMMKVKGNNKTILKPANLAAEMNNSWIGWHCNIGLESLVIQKNGDIYRGHCLVGGRLGNVHTKYDLTGVVKPIVCNKTECTCGVDIFTTKKKYNTPAY